MVAFKGYLYEPPNESFVFLGGFYMHLVLLLLAFLVLPLQSFAKKIPKLNADPHSITVSGISSGAFMAVQLGVAYSSQIKGVAAIAGGIYGCAEGQADKATTICMKNPAELAPETYVNLVHGNFERSLIDDPKNLAQQRVFILSGSEDKIVLPVAGQKLEEFYRHFRTIPRTEYSLKMGHGFPSNKVQNECAANQLPWVNNCDYDGAKAIFETFYGPLKPTSDRKLTGELWSINQTEFAKPDAKMLSYGHLYIPAVCRDKKIQCRIHVALHGCLQSPNIALKAFIEDAGYNDWAEENQIVVLYPAVGVGSGNPKACWDWFGYTGKNYTVKSAPQMTAIMKMVQRLTEQD